LGDDVDASDMEAHEEDGTEHSEYLCADCAGPYMEGDEPDDPRHLVVVIDNAINEVLARMASSGDTFDGVIDIGDGLHALGMLTGRDVRAEVAKAYEEDH
jgi:hypothetical protein